MCAPLASRLPAWPFVGLCCWAEQRSRGKAAEGKAAQFKSAQCSALCSAALPQTRAHRATDTHTHARHTRAHVGHTRPSRTALWIGVRTAGVLNLACTADSSSGACLPSCLLSPGSLHILLFQLSFQLFSLPCPSWPLCVTLLFHWRRLPQPPRRPACPGAPSRHSPSRRTGNLGRALALTLACTLQLCPPLLPPPPHRPRRRKAWRPQCRKDSARPQAAARDCSVREHTQAIADIWCSFMKSVRQQRAMYASKQARNQCSR
jgi:hypothetical protein